MMILLNNPPTTKRLENVKPGTVFMTHHTAEGPNFYWIKCSYRPQSKVRAFDPISGDTVDFDPDITVQVFLGAALVLDHGVR